MPQSPAYTPPPWEGGPQPVTITAVDGSTLQIQAGFGITFEQVAGVTIIHVTSQIPVPTTPDGITEWADGFEEVWATDIYTDWV